MPRLIILEGPDKTGKTTLAKALLRFLSSPTYLHQTGDPGLHTAMQSYHRSVVENAEFALSNGRDVVLDRLWMSEVVYHAVTRPNLVRTYDANFFKSWVVNRKGLYILCAPCAASVKSNIAYKDYEIEVYDKLCNAYSSQYMDMIMGGPVCFVYSREYWKDRVDDAAKSAIHICDNRP